MRCEIHVVHVAVKYTHVSFLPCCRNKLLLKPHQGLPHVFRLLGSGNMWKVTALRALKPRAAVQRSNVTIGPSAC